MNDESVIDKLAKKAHFLPGEMVEVTFKGRAEPAVVVFEENNGHVGVMFISPTQVEMDPGRWVYVEAKTVAYPEESPQLNSVWHLNELAARGRAGDKEACEKHDEVLAKLGPVVWIVKRGKDSVGLDSVLVGVFATRDAAVEHVEGRKLKDGRQKYMWGDSRQGSTNVDKKFRNRWTDGYRNIVLSRQVVLPRPAFTWFAESLSRSDG